MARTLLAAATLPGRRDRSRRGSSLEDPRTTCRGAPLVAALALAAGARARSAGAMRLTLVALTAPPPAWIVFGAQLWELLPFRDERVLARLSRRRRGHRGLLRRPSCPSTRRATRRCTRSCSVAVFGFVAAIASLVAASQPLAAAAVTIAGAGWPATLLADGRSAIGALALAAALSIPLVLRARSLRALAAGRRRRARRRRRSVGVLRTTLHARGCARLAELGHGEPGRRRAHVRFVWDAQYDGIAFPADDDVVLRIYGPDRAQYWRVSTLDAFIADRWFEDLFGSTSGPRERALQLGAARAPSARATREHWVEQHVRGRGARRRSARRGRHAGGGRRASARNRLPASRGRRARAGTRSRRGRATASGVTCPIPRRGARGSAPCRYPPAARRVPRARGPAFPRVRRARTRAHGRRDLLRRSVLCRSRLRTSRSTRSRGASRRRDQRRTRPCSRSSRGSGRRGGFRYDEPPPATTRARR